MLHLYKNNPASQDTQQGTRPGYVITGYLNKETSSDTEINPNRVEGRCDFAVTGNYAKSTTQTATVIIIP